MSEEREVGTVTRRKEDAATAPKRTRRELLAGAAGAVGVLAAEAVANMPAARANDGDNLLLGRNNYAQSTTSIIVYPASQPTTGFRAYGWEGGNGVEGVGASSQNYPGGTGIYGTGGNPNGVGLSGEGVGTGAGVQGTGGGSGGTGVVGKSGGTNGTGVAGTGAGNGHGVAGLGGAFGAGVSGSSASSTGVGVLAGNSNGGRALDVEGRAIFTQAGMVQIPYPNKTATVSVRDGLATDSLVLATVQNSVGVFVKAAVPDVGAGTVQIVLNKAPGTSTNPKTATVGWFVVEAAPSA